jgi:hypothetical protein
MEFFSLNLGQREHIALLSKGYLKIKFVIPKEQLKTFDMLYRPGKEVIFDYNGEEIKTIITGIDVTEEDKNSCKIFLGFAMQ